MILRDEIFVWNRILTPWHQFSLSLAANSLLFETAYDLFLDGKPHEWGVNL
jgi:hypothetical protein